MYHVLSDALFWCYWTIAAGTGVLVLRELLRASSWKVQLTAAMVLLPLILRVLLIK